MAHYGRRVKHPRMSPEMRRRLESEMKKSSSESSIEGKGGKDENNSILPAVLKSDIVLGADGAVQQIHEQDLNEATAVEHDRDRLDMARRETEDQDDHVVTTVVATVVDIVIDNGSRTLGEFTVATLPAVVSNSALGLFTIPVELNAPIIVPSLPASGSFVSPSPGYPSPSSATPSATHQNQLSTASEHSFSHIESSSGATASRSSSTSTSTSASAKSSFISSASLRSSTVSVSSSSTAAASSTGSTTFHSTVTSSSGGTTGVGGGGGHSTAGSEAGEQPSSTNNAQSQSSSSSGGIDTPRVVGGVVGGVAGAALLLLLVLLLLRWRKHYVRKTRGGLPSDDLVGGGTGQGSVPRSVEMMSQRSSTTPFAAAAASTGLFNRWRQSTQTVSSQDTAPSERGFQKISGRKIPSVLRSGGDGYGGALDEEPVPGTVSSGALPTTSVSHTNAPIIVETLAEGPETETPTSPYGGVPLGMSTTRETEGERPEGVVMRPSPARSPVTSSVNLPASGQCTPQQAQGSRATSLSRRPDLIGRSHPSFDGSRGSRFTESL